MDTSLYRSINHLAVHTAWLHPLMKLAALDFVGLFGVLVLAGWWWARSAPEPARAVAAAVWSAGATLLAVWGNQLIVQAVKRPRPFLVVTQAEVLVHRSSDYSFPSDHAVAAGAATVGLWILARYGVPHARRLAQAATALALVVAFARVYVGVHYPGDVLAGLGVGGAVAVVGWFMVRTWLSRTLSLLANKRLLRRLVVAKAHSTAT